MGTLFVGGCQRSGTSLLYGLICQGGCVNPPLMEAKYLQMLMLAYHMGVAEFDSRNRDYFGDLSAFQRFHGGLVDQFLDRVRARYPACSHLCFKEPHLTMLFPHVASLVPESRFICIVRDPRDVIASLIRVGERMHATGVVDAMGQMFHSRQIEAMVAYFSSFYAPLVDPANEAFRRQCAFVRYEDLVRAPDQVLPQLGDFSGLPLAGVNPALGRPDGDAAANSYDRAWLTPLSGRGVSDSRIGGFREVLSAAEASCVQDGTAAFRSLFGYGD